MASLGLYVHTPWCVSKCPYCDFNSHALSGELPATEYVNALVADLQAQAPFADKRTVSSIFIGGGTPSLFPPDEIERVLLGADEALDLSADVEITMEANPGTIECGSLPGYRAAGVNRLSMGLQSLNDRCLKAIGRLHDAETAKTAVQDAKAAGFENINVDLMYGLPTQSRQEALEDVRQAIALETVHLSHYQLTLEPNTVFYHSPPALPADAEIADMLERCRQVLTDAGFVNYEVSAFAKAGQRCRHNLNYWRFGDYLAVGAGAHGKLTGQDGKVRRFHRPAHPRSYLAACQSKAPFLESASTLSDSDRVFEFFLNGLRLREGLKPAALGELDPAAQELLDKGLRVARTRRLLESPDGLVFTPTELGFRFLNDLQALFLP
ncbi:MAG: radical SAM family heme chaperone HemW [Pseudomonadota bacterium]